MCRVGATLLLRCAGFLLRWILLLRSTGSRCAGFSSCGSWALELRLCSCGTRAWLLCGMWDLPGPGLQPMSPALAGRFLTTVPPGKLWHNSLKSSLAIYSKFQGTSLAVQWLSLHSSTAGDTVSSPGRGTKIWHITQRGWGKKKHFRNFSYALTLILLIRIYPKGVIRYWGKDCSIGIFTVALFIVAKIEVMIILNANKFDYVDLYIF